jgi:hypothetical protein
LAKPSCKPPAGTGRGRGERLAARIALGRAHLGGCGRQLGKAKLAHRFRERCRIFGLVEEGLRGIDKGEDGTSRHPAATSSAV